MKKLVIALLGISLVGCQPKTDPVTVEFNTLKSEVIDIHDVAMAKMSDMTVLRKQLIAEMDSSEVDSTYVKAINDLKGADGEMMQWMRDFSGAFTSDQLANGLSHNFETEEEKQEAIQSLELLKGYKVSAEEMKQHIDEAILQAQTILSISTVD